MICLRYRWLFGLALGFLCIFGSSALAATYYVAPGGDDSNPGTQAQPWSTFNRAWKSLYPGDTLYLMDGIYYQALAPDVRDGAPNPAINISDYKTYPLDNPERTKNYIKIKALHDGKAIIDGQGKFIPVSLGYAANGWWVGSYYLIEGIVARNSSESVFEIDTRNVILRRCSGYNANTDLNVHVFTIATGCCDADSTTCDPQRFCTTDNPSNILVEDCVAAGSGRKMFMAYGSYVNVIFRRLFAAWMSWEAKQCGQDECAAHWPWGDGIEIYNWAQPDLPEGWSNSIVENSIVYGRLPKWGFSLSPNTTETFDNKFLGDIAVKVGLDWDGTQMTWPCPNPDQPWFPCPKWTEWQAMRSGFSFGAHGYSFFKDNQFQDLFAYGNAGVGIGTGSYKDGSTNNRLLRGTFIHNGLASNLPEVEKGQDWSPLSPASSLTEARDVYLSSNPDPTVAKARLQYRYVNGASQDGSNGQKAQSLWPWPMENRIKEEFARELGINNFSVTDVICEQILKPNGVVNSCNDGALLLAPTNLRIEK